MIIKNFENIFCVYLLDFCILLQNFLIFSHICIKILIICAHKKYIFTLYTDFYRSIFIHIYTKATVPEHDACKLDKTNI